MSLTIVLEMGLRFLSGHDNIDQNGLKQNLSLANPTKSFREPILTSRTIKIRSYRLFH